MSTRVPAQRLFRPLIAGLLLVSCTPATAPPIETREPVEETVAERLTTAQTPDGRWISWREHIIDDEATGGVAIRGGDGLQMADLDGDGYEDIVSVHEDSHHVRLAFGTGDPGRWELVTLAEGDEVKAAEDVAIGDLDQDGLPDLIVACELDHLIYFENPGKEVRTGKWPRMRPRITVDRGSWIRVFLADLDNDGTLEVTAANKGDLLYAGLTEGDPDKRKAISWFDVEGEPLEQSSWTEHVLKEISVPINARPLDLDRDGDLDIIGGSRTEARIFWFENELEDPDDVENGALSFVEHEIRVRNRSVEQQPGAKRLTGMNMAFADLNGDQRTDIVLQETPFRNVWLEQPADTADEWTIHLIGDLAPDSPTGVTLADIDGDGDLDLITGGYSEEPRDHDGEHITVDSRVGRLAWHANPGTETLANPALQDRPWPRHDISRRVRSMFDMFLARDLDRDGDLDFVATRGNSGEYDGVLWLEQVRTDTPTRSFIPARQHESRHLSLPAAR